ncbi:MAG: M48 family metalloprotease, partial [Rhodobacteraceae bacterium]|nr:M48 family metalloprotease [Paracoccaceae bacterium]
RRRMIDFSGQNAVRVMLAAILGRLLPGVGIWIANTLVSMLAASLSRKDEYEADEYAAALLTKAGIGTAAQKSLLTKLDHLTGMRGAPPVWLASHPPSVERVRAIETLESRWGTTP